MIPDMATAAEVTAVLEGADRILVQQVFRPIGNEYRISVPAAGSTEEGTPILFVKQKKLAIKEDIRFRLHPEQDEAAFMIKARSVMEIRGRYNVTDDAGQPLGSLEKSFAKSLLRSHWVVRDPQGAEVLSAEEASMAIALARRFIGFVPVLNNIAFVMQFVPFNFVLSRGETRVGGYHRVLGKLRDRYVLELTPEAGSVDRRLLVAFAVALDALQDR